jgi:single-strand DNA-binding protein
LDIHEDGVRIMASLNRVTIIGHLGKDPEVRSFQNGGRVCNLSVATSERWKDKTTGEQKEKTEWHRVVVLSEGLIGVAEKFLKKGAQVYLEGQLETRKFTDSSGAERYTTEVVLRNYRSAMKRLDKSGPPREADAADEELEVFEGTGDLWDDETPY